MKPTLSADPVVVAPEFSPITPWLPAESVGAITPTAERRVQRLPSLSLRSVSFQNFARSTFKS